MFSTMLLMFFGMPLGCPPEELPHLRNQWLRLLKILSGTAGPAERWRPLESWTRPALYRTENDLTGDSVLRTGWISWRRLQDNVTVGLLLEWEVVDRARRKKSKTSSAGTVPLGG